MPPTFDSSSGLKEEIAKFLVKALFFKATT